MLMGSAFEKRPIVFGEVLFDQFPDGTAVLGGAPFNVAWHLKGFGVEPLLISRIGEDAYGGQVIDTMRRWEMDTAGIQRDPDRPTGSVAIALAQGQPTFTIVPDQAYDQIDASLALAAVSGVEPFLLYHGSLALRDSDSYAACMALRQGISAPACVDVNLRPPWWTPERIWSLVEHAHWLKVNDDEIRQLMEQPDADRDELHRIAQDLYARIGLETLIVTLGSAGALVYFGNEVLAAKPVLVDQIVDTVGAGDAFSAVALLGKINEWPPAVYLPRALEFAARICTQRGAIINDRSVYQSYLAAWN